MTSIAGATGAPSFSVIIPTHGGRKSVKSAVGSVLRQGFTEFELIVVSDGEADVTQELLSSVNDPRLRVVEQPKRGVSAARNTGITAATKDWVAFLDDDDLAHPNWLETFLSCITTETVAVTAAVRYLHEDGDSSVRVCSLSIDDVTMGASSLLAGGFAIRRETLEEVGGYDERLRAAENQDLGLRLCDHLRPRTNEDSIASTEEIVVDVCVEHPRTRSSRYGDAQASAATVFLKRYAPRLERDPRHHASLLRIIAREQRRRGLYRESQRTALQSWRLEPTNPANLRSLGIAMLPGLDRASDLLGWFNQRAAAIRSHDPGVARRTLVDRPPDSSRARVLHLLPQDQSRGAQVYAGQLRDALHDDLSQDHTLVTLFEAPDSAARPDVRLQVPSGRLRRVGLDPLAALRLRRLVSVHQPAVVVAHGGEALKYAVAASGRSAVVYYRVGLSASEISRPSRTTLYKRLASRATRVVGVSQAVVDQLHHLLSVPSSRLALIPNGRDPELYHPAAPGERPVDRLPSVLFVGQLERGKRPTLFLDAVAVLRSRGVPFRAAVVGDGALRAEVVHRAAALNVDVLGSRQDVPELLRRADLLVMTSEPESEGMPGIVIEAGLSGLPVVATAAAGVADVVVDGETGCVVEPDTADALADCMTRLLSDPELSRTMGAAARERCAAHFTIEATARQWHALVEDLITSGDRARGE